VGFVGSVAGGRLGGLAEGSIRARGLGTFLVQKDLGRRAFGLDDLVRLSRTRSQARTAVAVILDWVSMVSVWRRKTTVIAAFAAAAILVHLILRFGFRTSADASQIPLLLTLVLGGIPLIYELLKKLLRREFGSDLLGGISIIASVLLGEYLAGSIIVLMLAGGEALESYALRSASSVLAALAKRMPSIAHRKRDSQIVDVALKAVAVGDTLVIYPHDICPVDGVVIEGRGVMDESYLTGEPFQITKTSGSIVISGAINGESALTIRTTQRAADSRYAKIMEVMRESEAKRPQLRRLGDRLGAIYTPVALIVASLAWAISGEAIRFLAVLVIATPCPLLIAIPIAIIGSISLCARRAIIVKSPVVLEQIAECRTAIFDKTGTLTYGQRFATWPSRWALPKSRPGKVPKKNLSSFAKRLPRRKHSTWGMASMTPRP
jgi:cation transport ATPase